MKAVRENPGAEMGGTCGMDWSYEKNIQDFSRKFWRITKTTWKIRAWIALYY